MNLNTIVPAAIVLLILAALAGCAGELHAERVEGSTSIRLKWTAVNAEKLPDATPPPPGDGQPATTGKG